MTIKKHDLFPTTVYEFRLEGEYKEMKNQANEIEKTQEMAM